MNNDLILRIPSDLIVPFKGPAAPPGTDGLLVLSTDAAKDGEVGYFENWGPGGSFPCVLSKNEGEYFKKTMEQHIPKVIATIGARFYDILPLIELTPAIDKLSDQAIFKWLASKSYQKEQGEQEYMMYFDIDIPKMIRDFVNENITTITEAKFRDAFRQGGKAKSMLSDVTHHWDKAYVNFEDNFIKSLNKPVLKSIDLEVEYEYENIGSAAVAYVSKSSPILKVHDKEQNIIIPKSVEYENN